MASALAVLDRQRAVGGAADEAHDLRGFLDQMPGLVVDARDAGLTWVSICTST